MARGTPADSARRAELFRLIEKLPVGQWISNEGDLGIIRGANAVDIDGSVALVCAVEYVETKEILCVPAKFLEPVDPPDSKES